MRTRPSLTPRQEDSFSSETIKQERIGFYTQIKNLYDQPWGWPQLFTHAISQGISGQLLTDPQALATATETELERFAQGSATAAQIRQSIDQTITQIIANIMGSLQPFQQEQLKAIAESSNRHIIALRQSDFLKLGKPGWGEAELFQQSFGRLFVAYRDLQLLNRVAQLAQQAGEEDAHPLTDAGFQERYGSPPWDFVNTSLRAAGEGFAIDSPDRFSLDP